MSWAKLDDGMPDDEKIADLSDAAFRGYVTGICHAARKLTDGYIPLSVAKKIVGRAKVIQELSPDPWHITPNICDECRKWPEAVAASQKGVGFYIHMYLKYNPTKERVERERAEAQARMTRLRSPDVRPNNDRSSEEVQVPRTRPVPVLKLPPPTAAPAVERVLLERPNIFGLYEQLLGRGVSPLIADRLKEYEQTHSEDCIEHCFVEAAESNAHSVKLLYSILDRHRNEGCFERKQMGRDAGGVPQARNPAALPAAAYYPPGVSPPVFIPNAGPTGVGSGSVAEVDDPARVEVRR